METRLVGFLDSHYVCDRPVRDGGEGLVFGWRDIAERFVQAGVVEPAEVLDDGDLGLETAGEDRPRTSSAFRVPTKLSAIALS